MYFNHIFFESIIFPASRKHARMSLWAGSQWNHAWVSPQLLKNSFTTSGMHDSNPHPSIFDSQHRNFGWNHADSHQFWLVKMVKHQKFSYLGIEFCRTCKNLSKFKKSPTNIMVCTQTRAERVILLKQERMSNQVEL